VNEFWEVAVDFLRQPVVAWWLTGFLLLAGLLGTVLPILPGHILIVLGAGFHWWALGEDSGVEWWTIVVLVLGLALSIYLEFLSGAVGAKVFGGSKWGGIGAVVGGMVGLFFMPFGLLLGPLFGAFVAEYFFEKKEIREATKSGVGSVLGTVTGLVAKVCLALVMAGYFLADVFFIGG